MVIAKRGVEKYFFLLLLLACVCSSYRAEAHFVEQFYVSVEDSEQHLLVNFDVGYAIAETRDNPNEPQPTRSWLVAQSDEAHQRYRAEAERYLRECITFRSEGEEVPFGVHFPDFNSKPYAFPTLLNQGGYYNVELRPESWDASLSIVLADGDYPKLVLAIIEGEDKSFKFVTVNQGEQASLELESSFWYLLKLGFQHVIPDGADHILFILGLCLMAGSLKILLWQSVVFTVAHSVSMGLVVVGILPIYESPLARWIEPIIALSIVIIAVESLICKKASYKRFLFIGVFGAVHGLGFAGSLGSAFQFLSHDDWIVPLLISNLGIELAQILLLALSYTLLRLIEAKCGGAALVITKRISAICIASIGLIWFIQRMQVT